jgi:integrase
MVTGFRRGELCSLRWRHLDLERGSLCVERSTAQTSRAGVLERDTKTETDRRIALDPETAQLLLEHRARVEAQCLHARVRLAADAFVFSLAPDHSSPLLPQYVSHRYRRLAIKLGLRSTRLHALRHYSATELLTAGVDLRTVAGRLGHGGGGTTTLKTYAAWVDQAGRRAAEKIGAIVPRPQPELVVPRGAYESIALALHADIVSGRLQPGDQLPTLVELAAEFTVAVGTAQRAITLLAEEGLIDVTRGRRAVVCRRLKPVAG